MRGKRGNGNGDPSEDTFLTFGTTFNVLHPQYIKSKYQ